MPVLFSLILGTLIAAFGGEWGRIYVLSGAVASFGNWLVWDRPMLSFGADELRKLSEAGEIPHDQAVHADLLWIWRRSTIGHLFHGLYLAPLAVVAFSGTVLLRVSGSNPELAWRDRARTAMLKTFREYDASGIKLGGRYGDSTPSDPPSR